MKLFRHPINAMLIHFPSALLPMDITLSFIYFNNRNDSFGSVAFYCLIAGVLSGLAAMVTVLIDLRLIPKEQKAVIGNGLTHGFINATIIIVYCVFAYKAWLQYPKIILPALTILIVKSILIIILSAGNYLGGKLIFQNHIGIN